MDWLLRAGTFTCLRQDCPKDVQPNHPCSRCTMPFVSRDVRSLIRLYMRCRDRKALPSAGGVLEQPELLMEGFDVIDSTISAWKKQEQENRETELRNMEEVRKLERGR